ncbi:MAG TPA: single-stranded DNA-binding protein [Firmicutes bacterium]|nr:single-stranded DNA-binding protein [Bacillota bacterium]
MTKEILAQPSQANKMTNQIMVSGSVAEPCRFSHRVYGESFYEFLLVTNRLSGTSDHLPVLFSARVSTLPKVGEHVSVTGQIRSCNRMENGKNRLILRVFAKNIAFGTQEDSNEVFLQGHLCKMPVHRVTPFGREICDVLLAVNRNFGKSDYIPCIFWGRNAQLAAEKEIGSLLKVWGRMQSRMYQKRLETGVEERTAYEVSASRVEFQAD